ncbi:fumarylacetoacetate hydrolase family protein [Leucobacter sp. USHLN153]|uniref:fumarylacetoacetate hydrolase family protein n=1 Tax=Leucobacter sp. USHLN153 TaxID=3081268 RepID=UPI0030173B02
MKYVSYQQGGAERVGVLEGEGVVPLTGVSSVSEGAKALAAAARDEAGAFAYADAQLLPASPHPHRVFCVGLNYHAHIAETKRDLPTYPVLFPKFETSLIGAHDDILAPPESEQVDYEAELAVIIGRGGRRIAEADALSHVLGYTVANDITMRDYQYKTHQWMQGKAWDDSTPLGPVIVTPDEVDLAAAGIRTIVNGETVQDSTLDRLIFSIENLIATVSEFTTLSPGDVILTGTPGGVGFRRDPQLFLHDGDTVTVEVDGVGRIDSRVVAEAPRA